MKPEFEPTTTYDHAASSFAPARRNLPGDWISYTLRRLEPWVAWSIAVYTAWLAVLAFPGLPAVWLFCLYAGLVGKWAEVHPPRHQGEMALRGMALIAGACALHLYAGAETGGPGGSFFFWLSITCMYYAFMLKPAWAAGVVACAVIEFAVVSLLLRPSTGLAELAASAGFLAVFPLLLAMRFGSVMRQPDEAQEEGRVDSSTALYNKAGLLAHGNELIAACRREQRPLSVAVFDCADLLEVRSIYGSRICKQLTERLARKLDAVAAERGLAARTGPAEFTVLLPGLNRDKALHAVERVFGRPGRIELDAGDSEIVLVPSFAVCTVAPDAASVQEVHAQLRRELAQLDKEERLRKHYMQRERERHSRPMVLAPGPSQAPRARVQMPPTMPAPLTAR